MTVAPTTPPSEGRGPMKAPSTLSRPLISVIGNRVRNRRRVEGAPSRSENEAESCGGRSDTVKPHPSKSIRQKMSNVTSRYMQHTLSAPVTGTKAEIKNVFDTLSKFSYNLHGPSYDVEKERPLQAMLETADEILNNPSRPIQCIEAAFVGLRLTQDMKDVVRFPISFLSRKWREGKGPFPFSSRRCPQCTSPSRMVIPKESSQSDVLSSDDEEKKDRPYEAINHLVIGLWHKGMFGAVGISRMPGLHNKPLRFTSLSELIWDFSHHYAKDRQQLVYVRLGLPISHTDIETVPEWRKARIPLLKWQVADQRLKQFQEKLLCAAREGS